MATRIIQDDSFHRSITNECHQSKNYAIIQQEKERGEWVTSNHIMLPKTLINYIAALQPTQIQRDLASQREGKENKDEELVDEKSLSEDVRKIFFNYDSDCVPLYENQEGLWREIEQLESFWGIESIKSPDTQSSQPLHIIQQTPGDERTPNVEQRDIPSYTQDLFLLDTPPVNNCLAPKKRRLVLSPQFKRLQSNQKDATQRILFEDSF